jgi:iron uptake system EfeUOB component EfeO/EfeM
VLILASVRRTAPIAATLTLTAGLLLAACGGSAPQANLISVSNGGCGGGWHVTEPGPYTFQIRNAAAEEGDVDLVNPASGAIYAEVEMLGPGTTSPMRLDLGSGRYAFRCTFEDFDPFNGPTETVAGHTAGSAGIAPVTQDDLLQPAKQYQAYVVRGLVKLASETGTLVADVHMGNLAKAKLDWLPAHLQYELLGAAYDAFGDFDDEIDGRPDGLTGGVSSPQWTGFYRLEYGLWHGQSQTTLTPVATTLDKDVLALQKAWPTLQIGLLDIGLRTHEILENALQFQLSGHDDYGSGTTLATTVANIAGTEELLSILHPLLVTRYKELPAVSTWLDRLQSLIFKYGNQNWHWSSVASLSVADREQIVSACGQALEELAPIAAMTEPRGV